MLKPRFFPALAIGAALVLAMKLAEVASGLSSISPAIAADAPPPEEAPHVAAPDEGAVEAPAETETTGDAFVVDPANMSASEIAVLQALSARRAELEERSRELDLRDQLLAATEKRVNERIADLKAIETHIESLMRTRDEQAELQIASLVKVYETMKPVDAARIFEKLDPDVLLDVAQRMKPAKIALVLAAMEPTQAQLLTVRLASRLTLPPATAETVAPNPPATPAPGTPG
ncbi:MAG: hypothetical protein GC199_10925 [Alphaproteobacteria bacterium]|nr:hypothetical protein [Alphaproteobacteria bacterium]